MILCLYFYRFFRWICFIQSTCSETRRFILWILLFCHLHLLLICFFKICYRLCLITNLKETIIFHSLASLSFSSLFVLFFFSSSFVLVFILLILHLLLLFPLFSSSSASSFQLLNSKRCSISSFQIANTCLAILMARCRVCGFVALTTQSTIRQLQLLAFPSLTA